MMKRRGTGAAPVVTAPTAPAGGSPLLHKVFSTKNVLLDDPALAQSAQALKIRKEVEPNINELVKETKWSFMEKGEFFYLHKHLNSFRLAKMRRHIEFCEAKSASELLTEMKKRIPISSIQALVQGAGSNDASPQAKKKKGSVRPQPGATADTFYFTIVTKTEGGQEERYDLHTSNRRSYVDWYDGLRFLIGNEPELPETLEELEVLKGIEMECRLIEEDSKGEQSLSLSTPAIPPLPTDFNFYYK